MDGLNYVGVEIINPGAKEGSVDMKIKALLLKIIHNESHRPGNNENIEIIVLLSADRDYSPEIQALRRFGRFRVLLIHSGNSKDYMIDGKMIDAFSTRWSNILANATEQPSITAAPSIVSAALTNSTNFGPVFSVTPVGRQANPLHSQSAAEKVDKWGQQKPISSEQMPTIFSLVPSAAKAALPSTVPPTAAVPACNILRVITNIPNPTPMASMTCSESMGRAGLHCFGAVRDDRDRGQNIKCELLDCSQCPAPFLWTVGEQLFFREKGFQRPRICHRCREARKNQPECRPCL
jgi:hypothetical protein